MARPKILIADDDERMRHVLRQVVASIASSVCEARDGGEAVAVCAAERPDWVVMDWRMKPMDGLRAAVSIKAGHPATRILILSQDDDGELRAAARRVGVSAFVPKENLLQVAEIISNDPGQ